MEKIKSTINMPFEKTIQKLMENLKKEGFGIITDIDMKKIMKEKIGKDMDDYRIIGACNPNIAYSIIQFDRDIGKNLPCSIAVYKEGLKTVISAKNPLEIVEGITDDKIIESATKVYDILKKAVISV